MKRHAKKGISYITSLDFLFGPRSIALFGAAHTEGKLGGVILLGGNLVKSIGIIHIHISFMEQKHG
ncbi:MAG: hypothetical protein AB1487_08720 [Thermodesulfobacteriota bacterium]